MACPLLQDSSPQKVFLWLQASAKMVQSCGCSRLAQSSLQQDVEVSTKKSFCRSAFREILCSSTQALRWELSDRLACRIKSPRLYRSINRLFEGRLATSPLFLDFTSGSLSRREAPFYDIRHDVTMYKNLKEALEGNMQHELSTERNLYKEEGQGNRGVRFTRFPSVLTIHLQLFDCDQATPSPDENDRFEFPTRIDLGPYLAHDRHTGRARGKAREEEGPGPESFCLHSVLVHTGGPPDGRCIAYVRPPGLPEGGMWLKYDNDTVSEVPEAEALEDSYGLKPPGEKGEASTVPASDESGSAYMLEYMRERDLPVIMQDLAPEGGGGSPLHATVEVVTEADVAKFQPPSPSSSGSRRPWTSPPCATSSRPSMTRHCTTPPSRSRSRNPSRSRR
jgi:hypothetical protein